MPNQQGSGIGLLTGNTLQKPVQLWDVSQDVSCISDVAAKNKDVIDEAVAIFQQGAYP